MPTFRKLVRLSAIPIGIWVASIGVAELAFRALGVQLSSSMAIYAPFGEGSYRVKPDVIDVQNWASGRFTTRSDRYGMRCDRDGTGCLEDGDTVDIMVFGDSQGFGQGVENADSIVGVLARDARAEGLRVGNLSVGGHGIANQFELAQDLPADVTPELRQVVLLLGPRSISSPDHYALAHVTESGEIFGAVPTLSARLRSWLRANFAAYVVVRDAIKPMLAEPEQGGANILTLFEKITDNDPRVAGLGARVEQFRDWAEARGARLSVVYLPLVLEYEADKLIPQEGPSADMYTVDAPASIAARVAHDLEVAFIDARPALAGLAEQGGQMQLDGDPHYNQQASQVVGAHIWQGLQALN